MIERLEAERLANAIHSLRPDWPVNSLLGFLKQREKRPLLELTVELAWVAQLPDSQTPARMDAPGPWKKALVGVGLQSAPNYREVLPTDCGICSRPFEHHSVLSKLDDHEYEPMSERGKGVGPTPEQKAALEKARIAAELSRTAAKEEPAPGRVLRDPAAVIANHQSDEREAS